MSVPSAWHGINNPTPRCERCGAVPMEAFGPVLDMTDAPMRVAKGQALVGKVPRGGRIEKS